MARITVEDCIERIPSRFELVMLAAQRARDISAGAPLTVDRDNDKGPVVALREIADGTIDLDHLRYELIHGLRRHVDIADEADDEPVLDALGGFGAIDETGGREAAEDVVESDDAGEDELARAIEAARADAEDLPEDDEPDIAPDIAGDEAEDEAEGDDEALR